MSKKRIQTLGGLVYSTDPEFKIAVENAGEQETVDASQQNLKIRLDTRHRAGKAVTLITGFTGTLTDIEELGKNLKSFCGTGGSVKAGEIIVQGDNREKVLLWLLKNGYKRSKKG